MPHVKRTFYSPPELKVDQPAPEVFFLAELNNRVVGPYVNNKVIYDLKKRKKSVVELPHGCSVTFEIVSAG